MMDIPVAIAMIAAVVGFATGAALTFSVLDRKVHALQADCRRLAVDLTGARWDAAALRDQQAWEAHLAGLPTARLDLVLDERAETVRWDGAP